MRVLTRILIICVVVLMVLPQSALAVITFNQLDDDIFVVSHRIKIIGSRGRATKFLYEKSASLCVAAGYSQFKILDQESNAAGQHQTANASARVQFFQEDGEGRIDCEKNASTEYVEQARSKLARKGYKPPPPPEPSVEEDGAEGEGEGEAGTESCTVEQISAMVRAGFSDEQIKAACPD